MREVACDLQRIRADHEQRRHDHRDGKSAGDLLFAAFPTHAGFLVLPFVPASSVLGLNYDRFVSGTPEACEDLGLRGNRRRKGAAGGIPGSGRHSQCPLRVALVRR